MNKEWSTTTRYFVFALVLAGCIWFISAAQALIGAIAISTMMKGLELPLILDEAHKTDREELLEDLIRVLFYGILKR